MTNFQSVKTKSYLDDFLSHPYNLKYVYVFRPKKFRAQSTWNIEYLLHLLQLKYQQSDNFLTIQEIL